VAAVVAVAALYALFSAPRVPPPLGRGSSAPDFELPRLAGGAPIALSALRGEVVLVNFWATWCKPCEDEMPAMQRLYSALHDEGFQLLAVSVDDEPGVVVEFNERLALTFPILMDREGTVSHRYQVRAMPSTFFVDQAGVIQEVTLGGPMTRAFIESQVTSLLASGGNE